MGKKKGNPKSKLRKAFLQATEEENPALKEICNNLKNRIITLWQSECHYRDIRRQEKERASFTKNW